MEYLIIDGYNVINSWPELKELKEHDLETAREKLVDMLAQYQALTGEHLILVFDAHMVKGGKQHIEQYGEIEVVFTREGETADHFIERLVHMINNKAVVRVVTSDWTEQQVVLAAGGVRVSAREFREELLKLIEVAQKYNLESEKHRLENIGYRLKDEIREKLEKWRRKKS
ncbi:MAG: uncharacterized protein PWQ82_84 [Thermosediminibacterales bacterium]|nr:uncharacterized protein [Thermosediminibacterales bacterium]